MSFRIDSSPRNTNTLITPGTTFRVLATSATLRKALTDSYWCDVLEEVCEGRLEGVAVRYTGKTIVLVQFRPAHLTASGHRYPLSVSIPSEFLVPSPHAMDLATSFSFRRGVSSMVDCQSSLGTHPSDIEELGQGSPGSDMPKLCVVCGRYDMPDMLKRKSGWKCKECKGTPSCERLRVEAQKLHAAFTL